MLSLKIRPASFYDIASIVDVRLSALTANEVSGFVAPGNNMYLSVEQLQKEWNVENRLKDGFEVLLAECDGEVIGFIVFNLKVCDDNIDNVVVAKEYQRKGVGRALVGFVEELAVSRGLSVITTDTTESAEGVPWRAYDFWRKMGYEDKGVRLATEYGFKVIPLVKNLK